MNAIHFTHGHIDQRSPDLDGAFNDNYESGDSLTAAVARWLVILWFVTTLIVGTFVIARVILEYAPIVMANISQLFI